MKIIHTADWHLGHVLYGYDRASDHRQALSSLADYVARVQPDALVVSGDIFHTSQPSAAAMQLLAEALLDMRRCAPDMHIVLTAGNHDSPSRHEVFRLPWHALNVTVVGRPPINGDDIERFIIPIADKGFVIALPYMHPRHVAEGFFEALDKAVAEANANHKPVIAMAHAAITGSDNAGHDDWSEGVIGSLATMDAAEFALDYDYLALGHIHHAQTLRHGPKAVRYSGSLIPVSFAENYEHSATLVDIDERGAISVIKELPLATGRRLVTLGDEEGMPVEEIMQILEETVVGLSAGDFLRINVSLGHSDPLSAEFTQFVANACERAGINLCGFNVIRKSVARAAEAASLSSDELHRLEPARLLQIYAGQRAIDLDDDMMKLFNEITRKELDASLGHED